MQFVPTRDPILGRESGTAARPRDRNRDPLEQLARLGSIASDRRCAKHISERERSKMVTGRSQAMRRDAPVCCPACGRAAKRRARQQVFCSTRCRKRANYAKAVAEGKFNDPRYLGSGNGTKPSKNASDFNNLQAKKSRPSRSTNAPLDLLGGGSWSWRGTPPLSPAKRRAIIEAEIGSVSP